MLQLKVIPQVLSQVNSDGVLGSILLNSDGELLACSAGDPQRAKLIAAIVANVWTSFDTPSEGLDTLIIDNKEGRLALMQIGQLLLCVYGDNTVPFGMLKAKTRSLHGYLSEELAEMASE
mmetsp:Transcript_21324/g.53783  ORF Transcript_21324/g.53783 Transcript_21324/m.53783 type:complete len:120 (+) Transcript_21324:120-479(+)|eukprot:CAMPEP_0177652168 /NCGR_PEP_ID=MMETSP0447-20121125/12964_1 /TAXON_ID=0 /ORGANISM="Stygamoeba regulata, Strain BSH-02190019" /LENGTH=119 /DNA_ID=CAMNT_0019155351 /DNA_START=96 /DNA_END=455 /DNA_ORIENTATION=+